MSVEQDIERDHLRHDAPAGLVVFLVALPLCLGIALASGAPLFSGLVAGVVGGIVVGFLSGSHVSVSGPAAGLAVIVASAITTLGSFEAFLAAVAISGLAQIVFAALRLGAVADYVPSTVIKGMLAAIGVVIVLKQIPHALGRDLSFEGDMAFLEASGQENTLSAIVKAVLSANGAALAIASLSLLVLLGWDKVVVARVKALKLLPAPLLVVILGVACNELFAAVWPSFAISQPEHLVTLPVLGSASDLWKELHRPSLDALRDQRVYLTGITIAVVGSLESLLSLEASEKLDPYRRYASPNRELFAQGVGNLISGLIGGLPVTSVVVRTSANVYAGARTRWSAILHAALLALAVILLPRLLNRIPLASLAAILIVVGMKLASPALFKAMRREGLASFMPFLITVVAIVFTDLLKGVLIGLAVGVFFVIRANHHASITLVSQDQYYLLRFNKDMTFVNKADLKKALAGIPQGSTLIVDGTRSVYVDRDVFDVLDDFRENARTRDITVELKNLQGKRPGPGEE